MIPPTTPTKDGRRNQAAAVAESTSTREWYATPYSLGVMVGSAKERGLPEFYHREGRTTKLTFWWWWCMPRCSKKYAMHFGRAARRSEIFHLLALGGTNMMPSIPWTAVYTARGKKDGTASHGKDTNQKSMPLANVFFFFEKDMYVKNASQSKVDRYPAALMYIGDTLFEDRKQTTQLLTYLARSTTCLQTATPKISPGLTQRKRRISPGRGAGRVCNRRSRERLSYHEHGRRR